jgi:hypothetical protein
MNGKANQGRKRLKDRPRQRYAMYTKSRNSLKWALEKGMTDFVKMADRIGME